MVVVVVQGAPRWHITNSLLSSFILSTDRPSHVIKRDEPKGSHTLAYFISDPSIVLQVCAPILKDFIPYYTLLVVQRYPLYLTRLTVPELLACVVFSSPQIVCHRLLLASTLSHHHRCCRARFARHYPKSVHRAKTNSGAKARRGDVRTAIEKFSSHNENAQLRDRTNHDAPWATNQSRDCPHTLGL